ncbi:hypothetical protein [Clostridium sp.]|uniref:hypothetical protein n=1 Tax=Clostridium sp. TaxID=1506 RepID=UPI001A445B97|nr:hypothetical protein [Clostridium sp.]MBK5237152.1 hypothetical protein [Clostridium sp.]
MKKKNTHMPQNTKVHSKSIPKSIVNKLGMLLGVIIPIAVFIAYAMRIDFFFITRILALFILIISIAAYFKDQIFYVHPEVVHHANKKGSKKILVTKENNSKVSFSLKNGTIQVVFSIVIIIACTYLGQVIYKAMG